MAVPKKKTSSARRGLRRAGHTHKMARTYAINCSNCGEPTLPHNVCAACGQYRGKVVFEIKATEETDEE